MMPSFFRGLSCLCVAAWFGLAVELQAVADTNRALIPALTMLRLLSQTHRSIISVSLVITHLDPITQSSKLSSESKYRGSELHHPSSSLPSPTFNHPPPAPQS